MFIFLQFIASDINVKSKLFGWGMFPLEQSYYFTRSRYCIYIYVPVMEISLRLGAFFISRFYINDHVSFIYHVLRWRRIP